MREFNATPCMNILNGKIEDFYRVHGPYYSLNLDPGKMIASFGIPRRRFTQPLHRTPANVHAALTAASSTAMG